MRRHMEKPEPPRGLIEIEGLAMNGLLRSFSLVECEEAKGFMKIIAESTDGRVLTTGCMEPEAARRQVMVLNLYLRQWGHIINTGPSGTDDVSHYH